MDAEFGAEAGLEPAELLTPAEASFNFECPYSRKELGVVRGVVRLLGVYRNRLHNTVSSGTKIKGFTEFSKTLHSRNKSVEQISTTVESVSNFLQNNTQSNKHSWLH